MEKPFDFKNLRTDFMSNRCGYDFIPFDISDEIFEHFPGQIKYDKSLTFIFYPSFADGVIGLIYCFSEKLDRSIGNTNYFGWGTLHIGETKYEISGLYLFKDNEHTTDYDIATEIMQKYVLLRKYE